MQRIIGGMFGLEDVVERREQGHVPAFLQGRSLKLASARSAFRILDLLLSPRKIWLPAYLCDVVVGALLPPHQRICWYPVDSTLRISDAGWLDEVSDGDLVVFITYFGFDNWSGLGHAARERGAIVVEDAAQALLGRFSAAAHYSVVSPRKFLGVPEGGILIAHGSSPLPSAPADFAASWWLKALRASQGRRAFDEHGGNRDWFRLFNEFESECSPDPTRISELSDLLLKRCVDYGRLADRRRQNYLTLLGHLKEYAMFDALPDDVVPLGFPVRLERRDDLRRRLFEEEIFPPLHWPVGGVVPRRFRDSHALEAVIMTLPCDQRYDLDDMQRMIDCFKKWAARLSASPVEDIL